MKRGASAFVLAAACGILMPGAGSAQLVGERVRVSLADPLMFEGVVTRITPDELELSLPWGDSRVVATGDVLLLERRAGRRQWKRGFLVGATVGAAMAWVVQGGYTGDPPTFGEQIATRLVLTAYVAPFYGVIGAAVGGLIKLEGWVPVADWPRSGMTPEPLVEMRPMPGGSHALGLGVRLRF